MQTRSVHELGLCPTRTRLAQVGWERIRPAIDCQSPWVEWDQILKNDWSVRLKLTNGDDERRRTNRRRKWLEASEKSPIWAYTSSSELKRHRFERCFEKYCQIWA